MSKPLSTTTLSSVSKRAIQRPDSFQKSTTGMRKPHTQFSRALEALLTGLLLEPSAFFHLLILQKNLILQDLSTAAADLEQILESLADSLQVSRTKASTDLDKAETRLQSAMDLGVTADAREVEGLNIAISSVRTFAKKALLPDLRGGGTSRTSRARPEALTDVVEQLDRLEKSLPLLYRRLTSFLEAEKQFDPVQIRTYLTPYLLERSKDLIGEVNRAQAEGTLQGSAQESLVKVLATEAARNSLTTARHPTGHVIRALPHHGNKAVYPPGSQLHVAPLPPYTSAELLGTQQPYGFPVDATLIAIHQGTPTSTVLTGSGQHFLYSKPLAEGMYAVTVPHLLVSLAGTLYAAPLTVGARTAAQVAAELDAFLGPLGYEALVKRERIYLLGPGSIRLPTSGLAAQQAELRTGDLVIWPLLIAPAIGGLTLAFDLLSDVGLTTYTHTFDPLGDAFADIAAVIVELSSGGLAIAGGLEFSADGDKLIVKTQNADVSYVLSLSTSSTFYLPFLPPLPPLLFTFQWTEVGLGGLLYDSSAVLEIGFRSGQVSTDYYSIEEVLWEFGVAQGVTVSAVTTDLYAGRGYVSAGVLHLETVPASAPLQVGDVVKSGAGTYIITAGATDTYNVDQISGDTPAVGIPFDLEISRTVLQVVSNKLDGSPIALGAGTAHVPLGIPVNTVIESKSSRFQVLGSLQGGTKSKVQDLRMLGVTEGCSVRLPNGVVTPILSVDPAGTYFDTVPLSDPGGTQVDILPAGYSTYLTAQASLRALQNQDHYGLLRASSSVLRRVVEVLRAGVRSGALVSAVKDLARLLYLISSSHRTSTTVATALQRLGTPVAGAGLAVDMVLAGYVPTLPSQSAEVAEAALSSLEEKGYDRAASLLLEGRYTDLQKLTSDTASSTKKASEAFQRAAQNIPRPLDTDGVLRSASPITITRG